MRLGQELSVEGGPSKMQIAALLLWLLAGGTAFGATQEQIDQITSVIERLCLSGSNYQLRANLGGRIQFFRLMPGAQGGIQVDVKNSTGGVSYLNEQIRLEFDKQTRDCMQPHINTLIDLILDKPTTRKPAPQKRPTPTPDKQSKGSESPPKTSALSIDGVLPLHVWEKQAGPEKTSFTEHRLGFIAKVQNNRPFAVRVNLATIEGCVPVPLIAGEEMLIPGETPLRKPVIIDRAYAERERNTIQRIRISGVIRKDSNEIPSLGIGYTGILFPLMGGRGGALFHVPETVTTTGKCDAIKNFSPQPSVQQVFKIGPVHYTFPSDIAVQFYTEQLSLAIHFSTDVLKVNPKTFGKLIGLTAEDWSSLLLPQMYEVPDNLFTPVEKTRRPKS